MGQASNETYGPRVVPNRNSRSLVALLRQIGEEDCYRIVKSLFPDRSEVGLDGLSQGKSGANVLLARPFDRQRTAEVPCAVKIDDAYPIAKETLNYLDHVERKLDNPPRLYGPSDLCQSGNFGIAYTIVGAGQDRIYPLVKVFQDKALPQETQMADSASKADELQTNIEHLFTAYLDPWYRNPRDASMSIIGVSAGQQGRGGMVDSFEIRCNTAFDLSEEQLRDVHKWAIKVSQAAEKGLAPDPDEIVYSWRNLAENSDTVLTKCVVVHGDLHLGNIIYKPRTKDIVLIDYGLTGHAHFLTDFTKLETDMKFRFIQTLRGVKEQMEAVEDFLAFDAGLQGDLSLAGDSMNDFRHLPRWLIQLLRKIRKCAGDRMMGQPRTAEYTAGLARYAFRTASYPEDDSITLDHRLCMLCLGMGDIRCLNLEEKQINFSPAKKLGHRASKSTTFKSEPSWDGKGTRPATKPPVASGRPMERADLTRLWDENRPEELKNIVEDRECAWAWGWPDGEPVDKVQLLYDQTARTYDQIMSKCCGTVFEEWYKNNEQRCAEYKAREWGEQTRLERAVYNHDGYHIYLSPMKYLYYASIQNSLGEPKLRGLREEVFENAITGLRDQKTLVLPSSFAIHMAVVGCDGKALLRQRQGVTLHYPGAWEAGVGEFMHGPKGSTSDDFPHFSEGHPDLGLFLKSAVAEELNYWDARPHDFRLYGFALEYRTLAPKLLAVYWSDADVDRLARGAVAKTTQDRSFRAEGVELTPEGVVRAIRNTSYKAWGPTSKLALMLALFGKDPTMDSRSKKLLRVQELMTAL